MTGAKRGIGFAMAKALAARGGIRVLLAARSAADAEAAALAVPGETAGVAHDLADPGATERWARALEAEHGPIDILVNSAGILAPGDGLDASVADLALSLSVNAVSPFALIRALGPAMQARGWGRIVNLSSGWGSFAQGLDGPIPGAAVRPSAIISENCPLVRPSGRKERPNGAAGRSGRKASSKRRAAGAGTGRRRAPPRQLRSPAC